MKDHLRGIHTIPDYCPRCHRPFDTVQLRNDHLREEAYEVVENLHAPDGITSQRMPLPGQRVLLKLSKEGQWFHLFDLPFPHFQPRPDSAYNKIASSGLLPNFRDFISQPSALEILLERVRINPVWTSKLEVILREDFVYGLNQIYPRWAATQDLETGQVPAIVSPSQEHESSSAQITNEEATVLSPHPEARSSDNSDWSVPESETREASGVAGSATLQGLQEHGEP